MSSHFQQKENTGSRYEQINRYKLLREKAKQNDKANQMLVTKSKLKCKKQIKSSVKLKNKKKKRHNSRQQKSKHTISVKIEKKYFNIGDQIALKKDNLRGTVYYAGKLKGNKYSNKIYYGIVLTQKKGNCNGTYKNKSYFKTNNNYGLFVTKDEIKSIAYNDIDQHEDKYGDDWKHNNQLLLEFFWQILSYLMPFLENSDCCNVLNIKMGFISSINTSILNKISFVIDRYKIDLDSRLEKLNNEWYGVQYRMINFVNYKQLKDTMKCDHKQFDFRILSDFASNVINLTDNTLILGTYGQLSNLYDILPVEIERQIFHKNAVFERDEKGYEYTYNDYHKEIRIVSTTHFHELFEYELRGYQRLKDFFMVPILSYCIQKWVFINCLTRERIRRHYHMVCAWLSNECVITVLQNFRSV